MGEILKIIMRLVLGGWIFLFLLFYLWNEGGGIGFSLIMTLIISSIYWMQLKPSAIDKYKYKRKRSEENPLYAGGYFRKGPKDIRKRLMLAGPKVLYLCEVHAIIQIIVIWIYGISSIWNGENFIIRRYLVLWMLGGAVINIIAAFYYEHIIKKSLKEEKLQRGIKSLAFLEWSPFLTLTNDAMLATHIPVAGTDIKKVKQSFDEICEKKGYVLFKEYHQEKFDSISFFVKKQHGMVKIFAIIQREIIDYSTTVILNQMLERLLEEYFGTKYPIKRIFFIFCECINGDTYTKVNVETKQLPWRYLLRTYYSFEKQEFIISRQKSKFGRKQYEQMYREFLEMIEEMR